MCSTDRGRRNGLYLRIDELIDDPSRDAFDHRHGRGVSTTPTGCRTTTPRTPSAVSPTRAVFIRRLWTEAEPFDFVGKYVHLAQAWCNPKPVQQPHPPIVIGGRSTATLRVAAEHADVWNIPIDGADTPAWRPFEFTRCRG